MRGCYYSWSLIKKGTLGCGVDSSGSRWGPVLGLCELGNELSGSIEGGEFIA
jgi:hypothetical protein